MSGWFQKLFKSKVFLSTQRDPEAKVTGVSPSLSPPSSSSSLETAPFKPQKLPSALSSQTRWRRKYDLLVCHSVADIDTEEAKRLVSFLEASPCSLRCFLWQRDVCPGSAVPTEFCQVVQECHLQVLLITPNFLQEAWCMYMMHQTLAEGPVSNRLIPLILNLSHAQYPRELKFYFYINLSRNTGQAYSLINKTVLKYLEDQVKHEKTHDCSMDSTGNIISGADDR
ncbi:toll/interleukin-1 receptor domain-containing adapter protein-like [Solea solea]|uniref:toll/interleukin-1 receptor domain-containing adapter protein-like n=1 Tax=Solea solea TaxID=90069 RepID=UPI00272953FA|nr:toll/interleukin-1 receptor domain-containing adapter protein-like [Solea solea]XP_058490177.1 toll/interleukin-1 receptor domain-containing adapter protein-like [Solea solea]XP_058490178.1 toll/interleukin-1 receptor domain-containing adapter protein-like [Solea solea]